MSHSYPSDITIEQFNIIQPILESSRKKTRPRQIDLYSIFCALLYILKTGAQWRMLPKEYPKWELCYYYFRVWNQKPSKTSDTILEQVLKKIGWRYSTKQWTDRENQFYHS